MTQSIGPKQNACDTLTIDADIRYERVGQHTYTIEKDRADLILCCFDPQEVLMYSRTMHLEPLQAMIDWVEGYLQTHELDDAYITNELDDEPFENEDDDTLPL